jgi:glutathione S-transferase
MSEYKLYCFGESGNAYKVALMLELCRLQWEPVKVDFFNGETRSDSYRRQVNEMGEAPVLLHNGKSLSQSGVILEYLSEQTRRFGAKSEDERREIWRWMLFDNHKFTASISSLRFLVHFMKTGETPVTEWLRGRFTGALKIADKHLAENQFMLGKRVTIADLSMCGYLFYGEELPLPLDPYINVLKWLDRIKSLPGWKGPYELMPAAYQG